MIHITTKGNQGGFVNFRDVDLNLLLIFELLLDERRVSRVADVLGVSQPAVSNALAKLPSRILKPPCRMLALKASRLYSP